MNEPMEFEEKTVERAIKAACKHFGLKEDQLDIEIITKGSTGIFGIGGRKAKIRVLPRVEPAEKATQGKSESEATIGHEAPLHAPPETPAPDDTSKQTIAEQNKEPLKGLAAYEQTDLNKLAPEARQILSDLIEKAGFKAAVEIRRNGDIPLLDIVGEDLSLVIGKEGQTLSALEYLTNRILSQRHHMTRTIPVDAQGYREKRRQSLAALARRMAYKAKKTGRSIALNPMGARERRIIHLSLKNTPGIKTRSVGEGSERKVIISPVFRRFKGRPKRGPRRR